MVQKNEKMLPLGYEIHASSEKAGNSQHSALILPNHWPGSQIIWWGPNFISFGSWKCLNFMLFVDV